MNSENDRILVITEIYASVQGESSFAGLPCVFVRLTGCPLRCRWCDTVYGFKGGETQSFEHIIEQIRATGINLVELTGGEPLAQKNCIPFMERLIEEGFEVLCETSGSEPIADVPKGVTLIMDLKCPASGMCEKNLWANLDFLKPNDEIKFVIADRGDYEWAKATIERHSLGGRFQLLMSVAFGLLEPATLVDWMIEDRLPCRLNLQQHKYIWSPRKKGV